ncbi:hypothetical protein BC628DRAFT_1399534 [Trametes gibbosa]|nr:hypothetical protein BC628DRAFT_1399534 [Trametes gibbosa]
MASTRWPVTPVGLSVVGGERSWLHAGFVMLIVPAEIRVLRHLLTAFACVPV